MELDELGYGTPTIQNMIIMKTDSFLDAIFPNLTSFTFPKNSSVATKQELNQIIKMVDSTKKDVETQNRYYLYDRALKKHYFDFIVQKGANPATFKELIENMYADTSPLLMKMKYYFQRPRPYQLSFYYKLKLTSFRSYSADSPSFPSGKAYYSKLLSTVFGNHLPELFTTLQVIHQDICDSRVNMGLNYPSDIDAGIFAAENVLKTKEFATKYHI